MVYDNASATRTFSPSVKVEFLQNYLIATSDTATSPSPGLSINNLDGGITSLSAVLKITKGGGTDSPTGALKLQGTNDSPASTQTWVTVKGTQGTDIAITAADIATASTTNVIQSIDTLGYGRTSFTFKYLRFSNTLAGSVPTWQGTMDAVVHRGSMDPQAKR